ncbi:hypothetical protein B0H13DRAFT_2191028 [Mycena leptocephala]|nr:hypothetical protein B0H13DRAFT_2191028 [Mycena leptocephala]
MVNRFRVRTLDPSTAVRATDPGSLPEIGDIESLFSKAFTGDLFTAVISGHDPDGKTIDHIGPLWISTVVAGLLGGEVYVAETDDVEKKIVGCAVWFGPGHSMYDTENEQKHSFHPLMATFSKDLQAWWLDVFLPKIDMFVATALSPGARHNSWHLQTLAVDPEYQRKGVATRLINMVAEKARLTGTMLCLETETEINIEIYTKLGFSLMPREKGGIDECGERFTGVDGNSFCMWVLARDTE